jgi:signal transduction histidine kinase
MWHFASSIFQQRRTRRRWLQVSQELFDFNRSVALIADSDSLMASISARVRELFLADRMLILRAVPESGIFTVAFSTGYSAADLQCIHLEQRDRLPKWLLANEQAMVVSDNPSVFNYLGPAEREMLLRLEVRICCPLFALNRLTGLIMLSSTVEQWRIGQEDIDLLQMLMTQASIAFENADLYQQQRDRLRRLDRAERLATAGQLAASVAHEIRNPLTAIRSTVQHLLGYFDESSPRRALMEGVISEVDRIDRTVDGLLSFTRHNDFKPEKVALGELVDESLLLVRTEASKLAVEIIWSPPEIEICTMGDVAQLKQVLLNLMLNALEAISGGGQLHISVDAITEQDRPSGERTFATVVIRDSGCGIPAEVLNKILNPFFTTKESGTGLGLFISQSIIQRHGGEIEISSIEGGGTTVELRLPLLA